MTATAAAAAPRTLRLGAREYPVLLPTVRDPRLHLAAVIISLQVLGQTVLDFDLSIAQILLSVFTCATLEVGITFWRRKVVAWPASAMLTGNGVAFILRVPGTHHGDWWSLRGAHIFVGVAAISLLSKYLVRHRGTHVFNPSNVGLVAAFLVLGSDLADPLDFWWGPMSPGLAAALLIIVAGGLAIVSRVGMLGMAVAFWVTFAASLAVIASSGHCMTARWHVGPVCDASFWWVLVTSPEILVFTFFMITDPKTTPGGRVARAAFGAGVGFLAALLAAPQQTEFSTKVAVLASLTVLCVSRTLLERFLPAAGSEDDRVPRWLAALARRPVGRASGAPEGTPEEAAGSVDARASEPDAAGVEAPSGTAIGTPAGPFVGAPAGAAVSFGRGAVAVAVAAVAVLALVGAGIPARTAVEADFDESPSNPSVTRPPSTIDPRSLPPVEIRADVTAVAPDVNAESAPVLAADLVNDLAIESDALRRGDADLAATASAGVRLRAIRAQIDESKRTGSVVVPTYTFDRVMIVLVFDTANAQSGPKLGVEVHGTIHQTTYGGSPPTSAGPPVDAPFDRTFALLLSGDHYKIAADYPPEPVP